MLIYKQLSEDQARSLGEKIEATYQRIKFECNELATVLSSGDDKSDFWKIMPTVSIGAAVNAATLPLLASLIDKT